MSLMAFGRGRTRIVNGGGSGSSGNPSGGGTCPPTSDFCKGIQSWKPNHSYKTGEQFVYDGFIYEAISDYKSPKIFNQYSTKIRLINDRQHNELPFVQGGKTGEYYHINQLQYEMIKKMSDLKGYLEYNKKPLGDMTRAEFDTNSNGVIDKAETLEGLISSINELNSLKGIKDNVQSQINVLSHGMKFKGFVKTFADVPSLVPKPKQGDAVIIEKDETKIPKDIKTFYTYDGSKWIYLGPFDTAIRDFSINPLDINIESMGTLSEKRIDALIARKKDLHEHTNIKLLDSYTFSNANALDAIDKKHEHKNIKILEEFSESSGKLLYKGKLIEGNSSGGSGGPGISDLSGFTTDDLAEAPDKLYVTKSEKSNLGLLSTIKTDMVSLNQKVKDLDAQIPNTASASNPLITTNEVNDKFSKLKIQDLTNVEKVLKPEAFLVVNKNGTGITYQEEIPMKIQSITDMNDIEFRGVPKLKFSDATISLAGADPNTVKITMKELYSTDLLDMPKTFEDGKVLISNGSLMKYELKNLKDLVSLEPNFKKEIKDTDWVSHSSKGYSNIVVHDLKSKDLIVNFYDKEDNGKKCDYKLLNESEMIVYSSTNDPIKVVVNSTQGGPGGNGGSSNGTIKVTKDTFIDDLHKREDKTYSSNKIEDTLKRYSRKDNTYTKAQANAIFASKSKEHHHVNIETLRKFTEDTSKGEIFFNNKKLLTDIKPSLHEKTWTNVDNASLDLVLDVNSIYTSKKLSSIINSEFVIKNLVPLSGDEKENKKKSLELVIIDGTIEVLNVKILPQETQKYLLGISPNLKVLVKGIFDANYYIGAF